uniref:beta-defensin 122-like n=1 Tax=Jaculus jaculus TaxID=51337 RepID=UPI00033301DF|nr:beta-defensin 122-like [Jaculus jaculus]
MKPFWVTLAVMLLLSQAMPGDTEKCWHSRGSCRERCFRNERVYIFCMNGKLCCLKPKNQPNLTTR